MKHLSLHLLLSIAFMGQAGAMANKVAPRIIQPKQAPKIESPATNGMNDNDSDNDNGIDNDDDDYTVEAELMGAYGMQDNGISGYATGSAMQLEAGEAANGTQDSMQNGQELSGTYDATQDFEDEFALESNGSPNTPETSEILTGAYADTQDTTATDDIATETQKSIADREEEILK